MKPTAYVPREAIARMFDEPPINWWRFVPCRTCNAGRQESCKKGGDAWPEPARRPHASRIRSAGVLHGTLWLLREYPEDVLGSGR
jgi:hypothetical protein